MAGKKGIKGRKETRGGARPGSGQPKKEPGVPVTPQKNPRALTQTLPTEELRKRWRAARNKFKKDFEETPEYFMLKMLAKSKISINSKFAIFREYTAAFKDTVSPAGTQINLLNAPGAQIGSPQLLEEHPAAVALPVQKPDAGKEPANVIEIDTKQTTEGQENV